MGLKPPSQARLVGKQRLDSKEPLSSSQPLGHKLWCVSNTDVLQEQPWLGVSHFTLWLPQIGDLRLGLTSKESGRQTTPVLSSMSYRLGSYFPLWFLQKILLRPKLWTVWLSSPLKAKGSDQLMRATVHVRALCHPNVDPKARFRCASWHLLKAHVA